MEGIVGIKEMLASLKKGKEEEQKNTEAVENAKALLSELSEEEKSALKAALSVEVTGEPNPQTEGVTKVETTAVVEPTETPKEEPPKQVVDSKTTTVPPKTEVVTGAGFSLEKLEAGKLSKEEVMDALASGKIREVAKATY